jgi:hypothetical protein
MVLSKEAGVKEMITSLALLSMVSLLLAMLSLIFLLKGRNSTDWFTQSILTLFSD